METADGHLASLSATKPKPRTIEEYLASVNADHCAFYPMSSRIVETFQAGLKGFETSKGTIRFATDKPLPAALVKKLVKARIAELSQTR